MQRILSRWSLRKISKGLVLAGAVVYVAPLAIGVSLNVPYALIVGTDLPEVVLKVLYALTSIGETAGPVLFVIGILLFLFSAPAKKVQTVSDIESDFRFWRMILILGLVPWYMLFSAGGILVINSPEISLFGWLLLGYLSLGFPIVLATLFIASKYRANNPQRACSILKLPFYYGIPAVLLLMSSSLY